MSIYFYQVAFIFIPFIIFASLNTKKDELKSISLSIFIGIFLGFFIFKTARNLLIDSTIKLAFDTICLLFLALSPLVLALKFKLPKLISFFILATAFGVSYGSFSALFAVFSGELLDTTSIISLFLLLLAAFLLIVLYFLVFNLNALISPKMAIFFNALTIITLILQSLFSTTLEMMRAGLIKTYPWALSIVAKGIYASSFAVYFYLFLLAVLCVICLVKRPKFFAKTEQNHIKFRINMAKISRVLNLVKLTFLAIFINLAFLLYYDLYASRPPQIDDAKIIEPVNGEFVFDANALLDNNLHRYAYITDEGKEVRFFLLNRFADRLSPVAVFDACMICGDMGYVKKGDELICISCNVRIFLPSVGKEGGCNPIPMDFIFDGKNIKIKQETIANGANFFSKVVEKMVLDPVSRKKVSNLEAKSYLYYGKLYFFENNQNLAEFEANASKYVDINGTLK
ncbi:Fe-S-containing protein [Campylobacter gastrosuis]|uniref:Fe-S-containing protein n=1 Tax=Campylobacter gastrosuis TaxID=2974576 RepID=A0ABT7HL95_9BACT|nr:Fe-S-containing protein [Campylobacter gastrosuis]MDL0087780.1 Fe-S-containing protein [Campylobacter gastrosuis]MDL0087991.1 Fe-S-containing protein [Campylobacter gastrosuis]